ncbi:MAG: hypothetical protein HWN65_22575 [Candidatus Helarchaeota archaeon]|nr:hypothetical protein [Candidatus Helarchaeota archaeon]
MKKKEILQILPLYGFVLLGLVFLFGLIAFLYNLYEVMGILAVFCFISSSILFITTGILSYKWREDKEEFEVPKWFYLLIPLIPDVILAIIIVNFLETLYFIIFLIGTVISYLLIFLYLKKKRKEEFKSTK